MADFLYLLFICVVYLFLSLSGMTFLKMGHNDANGISIPILGVISTKVIIGVILYGFGFLVFVFFVSKLKISIVIPVVSGIYCAFTVIIGRMLFEERVSYGQVAGIVMVVLGTIIIGIFKE